MAALLTLREIRWIYEGCVLDAGEMFEELNTVLSDSAILKGCKSKRF
jgi:hypothetical protein